MVEPSKAPGRGSLLAALIASAAVVLALAATDYLPTHDGPHHLFQGYLSNHFDDPGAPYPQYFEPGAPISSLGFVLPFAALEGALGWRGAYLGTLALIALSWGWGYLALVRAVRPERAWLGLIGFGCALGWSLFMGMFAYTLSIGLGFAIGALAIRLSPWRWSHVAGLTLAFRASAGAPLHIRSLLECTAARDGPAQG